MDVLLGGMRGEIRHIPSQKQTAIWVVIFASGGGHATQWLEVKLYFYFPRTDSDSLLYSGDAGEQAGALPMYLDPSIEAYGESIF